MAEFKAMLIRYPEMHMTRISKVNQPLIIHEVVPDLMTRSPNNKQLVIHEVAPLSPTREKNVYRNGKIIPLRSTLFNDGIEQQYKREVREWQMVLTFGDGNATPRRKPLDIAWTKKQF